MTPCVTPGVVDVCADHTRSEHPAAVEALSSSPG